MFHSLSHNMASPKSFNSSNGPFIYPAPAQTRGKIFLCNCSVQLLEGAKWNAWDLQKVACQQLCWRKSLIPAILQGLLLEQPHTIKLTATRHSSGTQKSPGTTHLSGLARKNHKKKCYFSVSTPKLNWERRTTKKTFQILEADCIEHLSFFWAKQQTGLHGKIYVVLLWAWQSF